ncbi:hypothetical protein D917_02279 [Trichinella nativa]|uniref:Uncharacterized protein n=1 Tax=Trichinella nativa TaxID=6335 RepID=A0A1Y3EHK0_9BILA|nr:hypothetical protein D917_02279 [Trichinella nativa]
MVHVLLFGVNEGKERARRADPQREKGGAVGRLVQIARLLFRERLIRRPAPSQTGPPACVDRIELVGSNCCSCLLSTIVGERPQPSRRVERFESSWREA